MLIYLSGIYRRTEGTVFSEAETQKKREKKLSDQFPTTQPPFPYFLHYLWLLAPEILN